MTAQTVESPVLGQTRALPRFGVTARRDTPGVSGQHYLYQRRVFLPG